MSSELDASELIAEDVPCSVGLVPAAACRPLGVVKDSAQAFVRTADPDDEFLLLTVSRCRQPVRNSPPMPQTLKKTLVSPGPEGSRRSSIRSISV